ncbi:MAG: hypothetical protein FWD27_07380, partial [Coriobacteriia bacterium]|nr:hypothetical protein [Coriobacteriia bacterium]
MNTTVSGNEPRQKDAARIGRSIMKKALSMFMAIVLTVTLVPLGSIGMTGNYDVQPLESETALKGEGTEDPGQDWPSAFNDPSQDEPPALNDSNQDWPPAYSDTGQDWYLAYTDPSQDWSLPLNDSNPNSLPLKDQAFNTPSLIVEGSHSMNEAGMPQQFIDPEFPSFEVGMFAGINPLEGVVTVLSSSVVIGSGLWIDFWDAWADPDISEIILTRSITRDTTTTNTNRGNRLPALTRDLKIQGATEGISIGFGSDTAEANSFNLGRKDLGQTTHFSLENLSIDRLGSGNRVSAVWCTETNVDRTRGWNIALTNINATSTPSSGLVHAPGANLILSGLIDWQNEASSEPQVYAGTMTIMPRAHVYFSRNLPSGTSTTARNHLINLFDALDAHEDTVFHLRGGRYAVSYSSSLRTHASFGQSSTIDIANATSGLCLGYPDNSTGNYARIEFGPNTTTNIQVVEETMRGSQVNFAAGATANLLGESTSDSAPAALNMGAAGDLLACYFGAHDGAQIDIFAEGGNALDVGNSNTTFSATIEATNGSRVTVITNGTGGGSDNGAICAQGARGGFNITGASVIEAHSVNTGSGVPAIVQQINGGTFLVDGEGSELIVTQKGSNSGYTATIRFRDVGNQTFLVRNGGKVDVVKHVTTVANRNRSAAVRFGTASGNAFVIETGGQVRIYNGGTVNGDADSSTPNNGGNMAIEYGARYFSFHLSGTGPSGQPSACTIQADKGAAIDAAGRGDGSIYIGRGTVFTAAGTTSNATGYSIIEARGANFDFVMEHPLYYDFVNKRPGGGSIFNLGSGANWQSADSDVAIWLRGVNHWNGNPQRSYTLIDYVLRSGSGSTFNWISGDEEFREWWNATTPNPAGGAALQNRMGNYTRISANNAPPRIDLALPATNADQFVRWQGMVPEGLDLIGRPFWDGEVHAIVNVVKKDGRSIDFLASITGSLNKETVYKVEQAGTLDGVLRLEKVLSEPANTNLFLEAGDTYTIKEYWRGPAEPFPNDPGFTKRHIANSLSNPAPTVVTDFVPPLPPATFESNPFYSNQRVLNGTWELAPNDNPPVTVRALLKRALAGNVELPGIGEVNASGTWSFTIEDSVELQEGDIITVVFADANGWEQPLVNTPRHDMMLPAASSVVVKAVQYDIEGKNKIVGLGDAQQITTPEQLMSLIEAEGYVLVPVKTNKDLFVSATNYPYGEAVVPGNYTVTVRLYEFNQEETFLVHVRPGEVAVGQQYLLDYEHITERKSFNWAKQVTDAQLMVEGKVAAFKYLWGPSGLITTPATAEVVSRTFAMDNAATDFFTARVAEEPAVTANVKVNLSDNPPTLVVTSPIILQVNDPEYSASLDYHKRLGMTATDDVDSEAYLLANVVVHGGSVDIATPGVYPVVYATTDSDGNYVSSNTRYFVVHAADVYAHSEEYFIAANYVFMTVDEAMAFRTTATEASYLLAAGAYALRIDGLPDNATARKLPLGEVGIVPGEYDISFYVEEDPSVSIVTKFVVMQGNEIAGNKRYAIAASNVFMTVDEAAAFLATSPTAASYIERAHAHTRTLQGTPEGAPVVVGSPSLQALPGEYPVSFAVDQDSSVRVAVKFVVMKGDEIAGNKRYAIAASNVFMTVDEAKAFLEGVSNASYIEAANAHVRTLIEGITPASPVVSGTPEVLAAPGIYPVSFAVLQDPSVKVTVKFVVMQGDEIAGNKRYAIAASNVYMTVDEAKVFVDSGLSEVKYITTANAHVLTLLENIPPGSPVLVGTPSFSAAPGIYNVSFAVDQDPTVRVGVKFVVMKGDEIAGNKHYSIAASNAFFTVDEAREFLSSATDASY